jgi:hypothetical protein
MVVRSARADAPSPRAVRLAALPAETALRQVHGEVNSEAAEAAVMPEVAKIVALLADYSDATSHPFGETDGVR